MTTITPTSSIKSSISFYSKSKSLSEYGSKDIFNFTFYPLGKEMEMMLRFQGEEYRAPLSLHTTRKVAQKDPIFPP